MAARKGKGRVQRGTRTSKNAPVYSLPSSPSKKKTKATTGNRKRKPKKKGSSN